MRYSLITFFLSLLLSYGTPFTYAAESISPVEAILARGQNSLLHNSDLQPERELLHAIYAPHNFSLLWFPQGVATRAALELLSILREAGSYGLRPADYDGVELSARLAQLSNATPELTAQLDVGISVAALRFIRHLHFGRIDPRTVGFNIDVARDRELDAVKTVVSLANSDDIAPIIASVEPQFVRYQLLKRALARYRQLALTPQLKALPTFTSRSIKPDEPYSGAPQLRQLLSAEGDLPGATITADSNLTMDRALVTALQAYQLRHGLLADGILGNKTFAALTTPFAKRVEQIELTLERWRWLPPLQSPMIVVNIPQFKLFALNSADDREENLLRMDVIVGQAYPQSQTPIFLAEMKFVVFRPYWDVPLNITRREILPEIQRNSNYLARNHFELVKGQRDDSPVVPATASNIAQLASGAIRVRQQPGNDNALGDIKFLFPNSYNVYLHSTPAQRLFSQSRRDFSHGCIRVSDPEALAEYVLRNSTDAWDREKIAAAMQGEPNQRITLNKSIPVMIVYGTVMPLESGVVQFFDDIYGHDAKLAKLL